MSEPLIVGIRHHSPTCARLVKSLIESQRPRYVLIEGPADFNDRVDELFLAHQLPVAIYSYCQYQDSVAPGRGAWTPFAEFSPEWQALQAARHIQAQTYFIDLPYWAQSEEDDDKSTTEDDNQALLLRAVSMDNSDTLWDHLFEDESQQTALPSALAHYFAQLRGDASGDALNRQREAFMARWIAWAMQQNNGNVLVVCGGWHAPALTELWHKSSQENQKPELPSLPDAVTGCYLTPYSEKRLDVLAGYLSGMPAPVWQNWCWQLGLQQAGEQLLKTVLTRLRQRHLPASTADMAAAHLHAMALAQLRGHALPLRSDWLDALAGSLIKEALNAPLPWSYRGVIHPDTDPILLTLINEFHAHLHSWQALCHILRDLHSGVNLPGVSLSAAVALLVRRSQTMHATALDRGAALGALMRLEHPNASAEAALTMLAQLSPTQSGEALHGLLALARHQLTCQPAFIAGFSRLLNQLNDADFINALPDMRAAMAWLPPRERGALAHQVLEHYQLAHLPASTLQMPLHCPPQTIAHHQQLEQQALAALQHWGVFHV